MDFIAENKMIIGAIAGVALFAKPAFTFVWEKIKGIKLPKLPKTSVSSSDEESLDQAAIKHLRDRASSMGDQELLKMIKALDAKFYDIHTGVISSNTSNSTK